MGGSLTYDTAKMSNASLEARVKSLKPSLNPHRRKLGV